MKVSFLDRIPMVRGICNYASNQRPLVPSPLVKLPLGAVKPSGWLRQQLHLMEDGLTGYLHETGVFLTESNGWLHPETMHHTTRRENNTFAPEENYLRVEEEAVYAEIAWEEQAYWLRGAYPLAILTGSERLHAVLRRYTEAILASVCENGWFGPLCLLDPEGKDIPDVWPHMIVLDYLREYYEVSGDERVIQLMEGFFGFLSNIEAGKLLPDPGTDACRHWQMRIQSKRAGDMLPHIHWLYNHTKNETLLVLARRIYEEYRPLNEGKYCNLHGVHFSQIFPYPAFHYVLTGNPEDRSLTHRWYNDYMETFGQLPGGAIAADETARMGKTDPRQGFETCAMAELSRSYLLLSAIEGDPMYGDLSESVMLNSFPASHTADMKALHYLTAVNLPQIDAERRDYYNPERMLEYVTGDLYRCCLYNSGMGWPTFAQRLIMAADGDGVAAWLYAACETDVLVGDGVKAHICEDTDYPFDGKVKFNISCEKNVTFPFYLRIPEWCTRFMLTIDGQGIPTAVTNRILCIEHQWSCNTVEIDFHQDVRIKRLVHQGNCAVVSRGPLDYSLEIGEKWSACDVNGFTRYQVHPTTPWNYALDVNSSSDVCVLETRALKPQPWSLADAPIVLGVKGRRLEPWRITDNTIDPVPPSPVTCTGDRELLRLVPMGCARLRICCFPVIGSS